jgi:hypothetical protein
MKQRPISPLFSSLVYGEMSLNTYEAHEAIDIALPEGPVSVVRLSVGLRSSQHCPCCSSSLDYSHPWTIDISSWLIVGIVLGDALEPSKKPLTHRRVNTLRLLAQKRRASGLLAHMTMSVSEGEGRGSLPNQGRGSDGWHLADNEHPSILTWEGRIRFFGARPSSCPRFVNLRG